MIYYNYLSNAVDFHLNSNKKNIERTYSAYDYKVPGNKTIKPDKLKYISKYKNSCKKYNSCSNNKNKNPFVISS